MLAVTVLFTDPSTVQTRQTQQWHMRLILPLAKEKDLMLRSYPPAAGVAVAGITTSTPEPAPAHTESTGSVSIGSSHSGRSCSAPGVR